MNLTQSPIVKILFISFNFRINTKKISKKKIFYRILDKFNRIFPYPNLYIFSVSKYQKLQNFIIFNNISFG
jgi:hypothetical protein